MNLRSSKYEPLDREGKNCVLYSNKKMGGVYNDAYDELMN